MLFSLHYLSGILFSLDHLSGILFSLHYHSGMLFSSGLAATTNLTHLLNADDHVVAMDDIYGGTYTPVRVTLDRHLLN